MSQYQYIIKGVLSDRFKFNKILYVGPDKEVYSDCFFRNRHRYCICIEMTYTDGRIVKAYANQDFFFFEPLSYMTSELPLAFSTSDGFLFYQVNDVFGVKRPDDPPEGKQWWEGSLDWFRGEMHKKMWINRDKGSWHTFSKEFLFSKLLRELDELFESMLANDNERMYKDIISECADISNFAMFIADNLKRKYEENKNEQPS